MKREAKRNMGSKRRSARRWSRLLKWTAVLGAAVLIVYGLSHMSHVAYGERQLTMIDFSDLTAEQKQAALEEANEARCNCGCGMTIAQCVVTDPNCPFRTDHIDRIRAMVSRARTA
jgi:hypothetical protein